MKWKGKSTEREMKGKRSDRKMREREKQRENGEIINIPTHAKAVRRRVEGKANKIKTGES